MRKHNAHLLVHCCLYRQLVDIKSVLCISKTKLEQLNTNHVTSPYSTENVKQNCRCRFKYHNEIVCGQSRFLYHNQQSPTKFYVSHQNYLLLLISFMRRILIYFFNFTSFHGIFYLGELNFVSPRKKICKTSQ